MVIKLASADFLQVFIDSCAQELVIAARFLILAKH
jgi:hypothetical protein